VVDLPEGLSSDARLMPPDGPVGSPVDGQREDFYSVRGRQEINNNNSNNIPRRGSATGQSAAVRGVA
jgi:hypothetical protein